MGLNAKSFHGLVKLAVEHQASDIHLRQDESPSFRINGEITNIKSKELTKEDLESLFQLIGIDNFKAQESDGSYDIKDICRLRYNTFSYLGKLGCVLRIIKYDVPDFESLKIPGHFSDLTLKKSGITLVTGPTGSGKSSTLASIINHINKHKGKHIISLEDPVEFIHPILKSKISQREIGIDTDSFNQALRSALRQDPDIILIGEMRDSETVEIALKAAETGHHIFSTLHTSDAVSTVNRLISMFPSEEQENLKDRLSESLNAVICQKLVPSMNRKKVFPAHEIMLNGPGIKECILGKEPLTRIHQIIYESGKNYSSKNNLSSISLDQSLIRLYNSSKITKEAVIEYSRNPNDIEKELFFE